MSFKDHQDAQVLLQHYDDLADVRRELDELYKDAELGIGNYAQADELAADINEKLADLADGMAALLRRVTFE